MPALAPPPSTPTPAPSKAAPVAAKPAPTARPEIQQPPETSDQFPDAFAELTEMDTGKKPQPKKEAVKEPENPSDADGVETSSETTTTKTGSEGAESVVNATQDGKTISEGKPVKAKELRDAYEGLKKKVKEEYEPKLKKLTEYEARVKDYETKNPEAEKAAQEKFAAIEKRNAELESSIRFSNYKLTKEYKEHETNLSDAWASARAKLNGINISIRHAESGEVTEMPLTMERLSEYANQDPKDRWARMKAEIPDPAERTMVINHMDKIVDLSRTLQAAEDKAIEDSKSHAKLQADQQQESQKNYAKFWRESNENFSKQYPQWFAKIENDNEGNLLLDRGRALADLVFFHDDLTPERIALLPKSIQQQIAEKKPFTQQQLVKLRSIVANKAANHDRAISQNKALKARVAELEKSLSEFEDSGPDNVRAGTVNGVKSDVVGYEAELDALDRKGK